MCRGLGGLVGAELVVVRNGDGEGLATHEGFGSRETDAVLIHAGHYHGLAIYARVKCLRDLERFGLVVVLGMGGCCHGHGNGLRIGTGVASEGKYYEQNAS